MITAGWRNGTPVPAGQLVVPAFGPLALWGEGIFDTMRVHEGRLVGAAFHHDRTRRSMERLWGEQPAATALLATTWDLLEQAARATTAPAAARVLVAPGDETARHDGCDVEVFASLSTWTEPTADQYAAGVTLGVSDVAHPGLGAWGKTASAIWSAVVAREARRRQLDELLVLRGPHVVECAWSSVLWRQQGCWHTVEASLGGLPSTTIAMLEASGLEVVHTVVTPGQLEEAQAIVLASSLRLAVGVRSLGRATFPEPDRWAREIRERLLSFDPTSTPAG